MWRIVYNDISGKDNRIEIYEGMSDTGQKVINLLPSSNPIDIEYDDDDNIFTPIRRSTGHIRIILGKLDDKGEFIDDVNIISDIAATYPLDRPVKFYSNGKLTWTGFIQCKTPDHTLFGYRQEVSIPIISKLPLLEGVNINVFSFSQFRVPLGELLVGMFNQMGVSFDHYYFPVDTLQSNNILLSQVCVLNYIDWRSAEEYEKTTDRGLVFYDGKPLIDVLRDICTLHVLTAIEIDNNLMFIRPNKRNVKFYELSTNRVAAGNLTGAKIIEIAGRDITKMFEFNSTDHTISIVEGKNRVSVTGAYRQLDHIFELDDLSKMSPTRNLYTSFPWSVYSGGPETYEQTFEDSPLLTVSNNIEESKKRFGYLYNINSGYDYSGSFAEVEGTISNPKVDSTGMYDYDGECNTCIIFRGSCAVTINPPCVDTLNSARIILELEFKKRDALLADWINIEETDVIPFSIRIGTTQLPVQITKRDKGKLTYILRNYNGEPISINYNNRYAFCKIHKLEVKYDDKGLNSTGIENYTPKDTVARKQINAGFTNDISVEMGLTSKLYLGTSSFVTKWTEQGIAESYRQYYQRSRNRISVTIKSLYFVDPRRTYSFEGRYYTLVGMKLKQRDNQLLVTLQEID